VTLIQFKTDCVPLITECMSLLPHLCCCCQGTEAHEGHHGLSMAAHGRLILLPWPVNSEVFALG
jgi:hypothetical protein